MRIYRDAIANSPSDLGIITSKLTTSDTEDPATLRVTVINEGGPTTIEVIITYYDDEFTELETTRSDPLECEADAESTFILDVIPLDNYAYHALTLEERD